MCAPFFMVLDEIKFIKIRKWKKIIRIHVKIRFFF